jgi:SAM-dependent methyltransferase
MKKNAGRARPNVAHERQSIAREIGVHGLHWDRVHEGYFSDVTVARPFVEAVERALLSFKPKVVADLGGGTGIILRRLLRVSDPDRMRLVNVDISPPQLAQCHDARIEALRVSAADVTREDLGVDDGRLMLLMRSLLHYFGRDALAPFLRHIRRQLQPGEVFIHQSACFERPRDAECLNRLYQLMRTEKWYPTMAHLTAMLEAADLKVHQACPAPPLALTSSELMERYRLKAEELPSIRDELLGEYGNVPGVFEPSGEGFVARLHYAIFTCQARETKAAAPTNRSRRTC